MYFQRVVPELAAMACGTAAMTSAPHATALFAQVRCSQLSLISGALALAFSAPHLAFAADNVATSAPNVYAGAAPPKAGERLSDWLLRQNPAEKAYLPGLSWLVPSEQPAQAAMQSALRAHLTGSEWTYRADADARLRLSAWISALPVTGRVPVEVSDPRWLEAHPAQNPVLAPDHRVLVPPRPTSVTVVTSDGHLCNVAHMPGYQAKAYVDACGAQSHTGRVDRVWMAQPDGQVQDFGIASWSAQAQGEPAPGTWIWAPTLNAGWSDEFSKSLINFLATQGPAQDDKAGGANAKLAPAPSTTSVLARDPVITGNDWGGIGLLQTPTARMAKAGELSVSFSRAYPYSNLNVTLQPFDWMELGYRYTSISGTPYGPASLSGNQSYKDKSVDLKLRLHKESAFLPELSIGGRDIVGTGLFSGEYVVASKRTGNFDWSLGLGWGSLGSAGTLSNPLSIISGKFNSRSTSGVGGAQGGEARFGNYFRGRTALFGGVQIQSPWDPLILKLEYEGNGYRTPAPFTISEPKSRFNFGAVYRYSPSIDLTFGVQRGNVATLGVALHYPLARLSTPKINDPVLPRFVAERPIVADWTSTAKDVSDQTGWSVAEIRKHGSVLQVELANADAVYWREMIERATAILHRDAPADVEEFRFIYKGRGTALADIGVNREQWVRSKTQPLLPSEHLAQSAPRNRPAADIATSASIFRSDASPLTGNVGFHLKQNFGGPDAFVLYQASIEGSSEWRLSENTWVAGSLNLRAFDNYNKFRYTADSSLPRVRTFVREFLTTSRVTIPNLQLTRAGQLSSNQYFSVYGGYLESMYAGAGAEWLYRPFRGPLALGVDINGVRQRNFDQKFGLRDYRVMTGHATAYIETDWNDVLAKVSAGQYLAGDRGVTLDLSRRFSNGVVFGVFATKTNVSAAQFGEGSFDKGIYFSIPLSAMFTRSTPDVGTFTWNPLTRDGGAKLNRAFPLYDMTKVRDPRALSITSPASE